MSALEVLSPYIPLLLGLSILFIAAACVIEFLSRPKKVIACE